MRGCQCACVSECVICVSASAIVWGWERATGRGGGCGRCPRGRRVWARVAVGAAAVWAGVRAAVWFPGVCGAAAGCRLRGQFLILLSPCCPCLLLPAEPLCVSPLPLPCVSVCWGDPWGHGGHCHTCPGGGGALSLAPHPRGRLGSKWRGPSRGDQRAGRPRPPPSRGRGCRSRLLLFVVWGSAPPPLSLLAPGVSDWGWG